MSAGELKPKARDGLLTTEHSKRGRRLLTVLDPDDHRVTLLEAWENDILMLADGTRSIDTITELLSPGSEEAPIDKDVVIRCIKFFEQQALVYSVGLRQSDLPPPGPETMANLQAAFGEWHKEPARTGQFPQSELAPPFPGTGARVLPGLTPTVALPDEDSPRGSVVPGSTLVLAGGDSSSLLHPGEDETDADSDVDEDSGDGELLDVLGAVDDAVREADALDQLEAEERHKAPTQSIQADPMFVESRPPESMQRKMPSANIEVALTGNKAPPRAKTVQPPFVAEPEEVLNPTMIGQPPPARSSQTLEPVERNELVEPTEQVRIRAAGDDADDRTEELVRSEIDIEVMPPADLEEEPEEKTMLGEMVPHE